MKLGDFTEQIFVVLCYYLRVFPHYKLNKYFLYNIILTYFYNYCKKIFNFFAFAILTQLKFICYTNCTIHKGVLCYGNR